MEYLGALGIALITSGILTQIYLKYVNRSKELREIRQEARDDLREDYDRVKESRDELAHELESMGAKIDELRSQYERERVELNVKIDILTKEVLSWKEKYFNALETMINMQAIQQEKIVDNDSE